MNHIDMEKGETMFEFLKRKKKQMLDQTLHRNKSHNESQDFSTGREKENDGDYQQTKRIEVRDKYPKSILKAERHSESQSITPKRLSILQEQKRPVTRSFLQMISPIRSKSPIQKQAEKSITLSPKFPKKGSFKDNFTKKTMIQNLGKMRELIQSLIKSANNLKEKSHFLFVELKPFFRHLQNCDQSRFEKKTEVVKAKLKGLQQLFNQFSIQSAHQVIDSFYLNFSQYVNELQGISKAQVQSNKDTVLSEAINAKQIQIDALQDTNRKLQRQVQNYIKKYEKLNQNYEKLHQETIAKQQEQQCRRVIKNEESQQIIQELMMSKQGFKASVDQLTSKLKEKQNEIRQLRYQQQRYRQQSFNTINKVKSQQQEFLLNQIMVLKKEFEADITEITRLHQLKEADYRNRVDQTMLQNQKIKKKMDNMIKYSVEVEETAKQNQAQATRYKKQNQLLATDMHRINEQLYQHWLALKDIKTLAMRLDIFHKFRKIYEELIFNQQLFL